MDIYKTKQMCMCKYQYLSPFYTLSSLVNTRKSFLTHSHDLVFCAVVYFLDQLTQYGASPGFSSYLLKFSWFKLLHY